MQFYRCNDKPYSPFGMDNSDMSPALAVFIDHPKGISSGGKYQHTVDDAGAVPMESIVDDILCRIKTDPPSELDNKEEAYRLVPEDFNIWPSDTDDRLCVADEYTHPKLESYDFVNYNPVSKYFNIFPKSPVVTIYPCIYDSVLYGISEVGVFHAIGDWIWQYCFRRRINKIRTLDSIVVMA